MNSAKVKTIAPKDAKLYYSFLKVEVKDLDLYLAYSVEAECLKVNKLNKPNMMMINKLFKAI